MMANKNFKDAATLNMKVVVKETGLKPDTLRAWEKRYGLPQPDRTAGGHRLYSQHDVEILEWLIARQEEGLSISRAVDLWNQFQAEGQDPLIAMPLETAQIAQTIAAGATIEAIRDEWVKACMAFDEQQAEQIMTRAFALYPSDQVCIQVLMKGLSEIGDGWYEGNFTVQQEHFASELAIRRLETLIAAAPPPTLQGRILVLCPPSEEHTFSPLLITYLLRRSGRHAIFLGANVPLGRLEHAISTTQPNLVILSAQHLQSAANLFLIAESLQPMDLILAYGGRIFNMIPRIRKRIPGVFLGEILEEVPANVNHLLSHASPQYHVEDISETYQRTLHSFQSNQADIESAIWKEMMETGLPYVQLVIANTHMAQNIIAALTLGDIASLGYDINWVRELLFNHNIPAENLSRFVSTYAEAVSKELDHGGELISDYLMTLINNDKIIGMNTQTGSKS
jgi:DNA-binding transcriptional MerR regulator